jgi:hypothetical protein
MTLSNVCKDFIIPDKDGQAPLNILEYCEKAIQATPTPVQRFILKCFYGLKLNNKTKDILIYNHFKEKVLYKFTELDYYEYLRSENRISIKNASDIEGANYWVLCLPIGRRGGKTYMSAIISSYETYKLLQIHCPQEFFEIDEGSEIRVTTVATARDQSKLLYDQIKSFIMRGSVFTNHFVTGTQQYIQLDTQHDIERYGRKKRPSMHIKFNSCISRTLRGPGNIVGVMDECAHYIEESNSASSDQQVYDALSPSIAGFNKDGKMYGKIIMISSPLNKSGLMYETYRRSLDQDDLGILTIQAPCWESFPKNVTPVYLKSKYKESKENFWREFGAHFSEKLSGWIEEEEHLRRVIVPDLEPRQVGIRGIPTYMGIDLGLTGNGTAVCITAVNQDRQIELWYAKVVYPKNAVVDPIYEDCVENVDMLDFDGMADWIEELVHKFNVQKGIFDQWSGEVLAQSLRKKRITNLECISFTRDLKAKIYQNFKLLMLDKRLRLFDLLKKEDKDGVLFTELMRLQKRAYSNYLVVVNKSEVVGFQDDLSDALVRSVWSASQNLDQASKIAKSIENRANKPPNYVHMQRRYELRKRYSGLNRSIGGRRKR